MCGDVQCWFAFQCAALFRATVLALRERPIPASFAPLGIYIYAVGGEYCRNRLTLEGSARLRPETKPRMAPLVEFGAVLGGSASLPLPAPPLPSSSRRYAPQCFVGGYTSSPCDVSHRASDEPRRCMSLSSALAPSSLASPSIRRVFLRSICGGAANPPRHLRWTRSQARRLSVMNAKGKGAFP